MQVAVTRTGYPPAQDPTAYSINVTKHLERWEPEVLFQITWMYSRCSNIAFQTFWKIYSDRAWTLVQFQDKSYFNSR